NVEARFRKKSGDIATALFSMEIVPLQGQPVAVTMRVDITDRVRVEQALRESEERFALFMRHLPGAAFIKDAYGRYLYANPGAESGQRVPPGGSLGRTDEELFGANSAREFKATDRRGFGAGGMIETVESIVWDDEVQHWLVNKFPIPDRGAGVLLGGAAFNISELKRTEASLRCALEERERLERDLHDDLVQDIYAIGMGIEELRRRVAFDPRAGDAGLAPAISPAPNRRSSIRTSCAPNCASSRGPAKRPNGCVSSWKWIPAHCRCWRRMLPIRS